MSNVLALSRWKNHELAEREYFSSDDESDLEESSDDMPIVIPTQKPGQRKKEKPSLIIPKRDPAVRRSVIKRVLQVHPQDHLQNGCDSAKQNHLRSYLESS